MFRYSYLTLIVFLLLIPFKLSFAENEGLLDKTYEAHGGLEKWNEQNTIIYTMVGFPLTPQVAKPNKSTVDLKNRYNRIESEEFTVGFNGETAWTIPSPEAVGLPPRFFSLGSFYFNGMPFVFADPGLILTDAGTATFQGKSYRLINVGFEKGTGHSSKDDFQLLINPETNKLALINHSVTEIQVERVTWVFNEWQDVNGLLVPSKLTYYPGWNPDNPGEGAVYTIENVSFSTKSPNKSIYDPPANAVIDTSPSLHWLIDGCQRHINKKMNINL